MEPIRVRGSLRRYCVRHIRACNTHCAHAATAGPSSHAACENSFARLGRLCARNQLGLFAAALAQLLDARFKRVLQRNYSVLITNFINTLL